MDEILILKIRNLIVEREFNTVQANQELANGGWRYDHGGHDQWLALKIEELFQQVGNQANGLSVESKG